MVLFFFSILIISGHLDNRSSWEYGVFYLCRGADYMAFSPAVTVIH